LRAVAEHEDMGTTKQHRYPDLLQYLMALPKFSRVGWRELVKSPLLFEAVFMPPNEGLGGSGRCGNASSRKISHIYLVCIPYLLF
jgi:hypothetical protein